MDNFDSKCCPRLGGFVFFVMSEVTEFCLQGFRTRAKYLLGVTILQWMANSHGQELNTGTQAHQGTRGIRARRQMSELNGQDGSFAGCSA